MQPCHSFELSRSVDAEGLPGQGAAKRLRQAQLLLQHTAMPSRKVLHWPVKNMKVHIPEKLLYNVKASVSAVYLTIVRMKN